MKRGEIAMKESRLRQLILSSAWNRFARDGFETTSMADIAHHSGLELHQVFTHFPTKDNLVFELYRLLAVRLEERVVELPHGTVAERFRAVMEWKTALLEEHRPVLYALFGTMTDAEQETGVMSANMEVIRNRVRGVFGSVAWGATDRPDDARMPELIRHLYRLHLGLVFLWFRNPAAYRTALGMAASLLRLSKPALEFAPLQPVMARVDSLIHQRAEPYDEERELAERILLRLFRHRRLQTEHVGDCATRPCEQCLALHRSRVEEFIRRGQPIQMVLPAFPAKSPNRDKVLGDMPDTAEELALRSLDDLCREIAEIYAPGARIVICSDGHVFSDLVGVADEQVTRYNAAIRAHIEARGLTSLSFFNLGDVWGSIDYGQVREELLAPYSEPLETLRARVKENAVHKHLFDGLHRFLFEDQVVLRPGETRNRVRQQTKELTYRVLQRSNAWGRLVGQHFPDALRLSIHPQSPHSEKIGVLLSPAEDAWVTPWHGVALLRDRDFILTKRGHAEAMGARIAYEHGRAVHFISPG